MNKLLNCHTLKSKYPVHTCICDKSGKCCMDPKVTQQVRLKKAVYLVLIQLQVGNQ